MKINFATILAFIFITFIQCKGTKDYAESTKKMASDKLGADFECIPNEENEYTLCLNSKEDESNSGMGVVFFVVENSTGKIVFEDSIDRGVVTWHSSSKLSLFYTPGIMRDDQSRDDFTFIYDLETKEKVPKKKLESL